MTYVAVFLGTLFILMSIGVPIGFVLMLCGMALMYIMNFVDPLTVGQNMIQGLNSFTLMAIPFFLLAGEIMAKGGLSRRIVNFAKLIVGRVRGGLGYTAILASIIFAGLSGSAVADAAAIGGMLIPLMIANKYDAARSTGFICSGAIIAPIIPPSGAFILIGVTCNLSISKLFMGGLIPGVIIGLALMVVWFFIVRKDGYHDQETFTKAEVIAILKDSLPALMMPVLIVGGIRLGWFTPTEAGAFAVVYALLVCNFYYKELNFKKTKEALLAAASSTATIALIVGGATVAGYYMTLAQIPAKIAGMLGGLISHPTLFLMACNVFLFFMGMIMDITPNILIFCPILMPLAEAAGLDPYFFAFIMCLNLNIGLITPPVGTVLYVAQRVGGVNFSDLVKKMMPFLITEVIVLLVMTYCPALYLVPLSWIT